MLELRQIKKDYYVGENTVQALRGVDLTFRPNEFVSILGQSGCGKTTMLNIIGGLDSYTSGDLLINGRSTKDFQDYDWDAYRNHYVGFVFQSYNLIGHQNVLGNVELALTLSGISAQERKQKAIDALTEVGLADQIYKKPNQLSGGQMQRVAIARAIVNNPSIILADEPTGALDSTTSVQIMELLKEIAKDRLIIMVTHNAQLAEEYSTRIISLSDGQVIGDTNPFTPSNDERIAILEKSGVDLDSLNATKETLTLDKSLVGEEKKQAKAILKLEKKKEKERIKKRRESLKRTSMSIKTALGLSGKNLLTKKGRTFMISLAASIGIIGIALVLALSNGFQSYIDNLQAETLSSVPITVQLEYLDMDAIMEEMQGTSSSSSSDDSLESYPDDDKVIVYTEIDSAMAEYIKINAITQDYIDYLDKFDSSKVIDIQYNYSSQHNLINSDGTTIYSNSSSSIIPSPQLQNSGTFQELLDNEAFVKTQYDMLAGTYPQERTDGVVEVILILDEYNRISQDTITALGLNLEDNTYTFNNFIGLEYMILHNDNYYDSYDGKVITSYDPVTYMPIYETKTLYTSKSLSDLKTAYSNPTDKDLKVEVVGVMRGNADALIDIYNPGLAYLPSTTATLIEMNKNSAVSQAQLLECDKGFAGVNLVSTQDSLIKSSIASDIEDMLYIDYEYIDMPDALTFGQALAISLGSSGYTMEDDEGNESLLTSTILNQFFLYYDSMSDDLSDSMKSIFSAYLNGTQLESLNTVNATTIPSSISIYPLDFETKAELTAYLDAYVATDGSTIYYSDSLSMLTSTMGSLIDIISYVLIAFAAISLVVSSIMIAIITYVSVIERTKEIGVLRSIGARKKDISRVFNAETIIIGLSAGLLGVAIAYLLSIPINLIISALISANSGMSVGSLMVLHPLHALALVTISTVLTLISGLIPSRMAAKKDPVEALRSE